LVDDSQMCDAQETEHDDSERRELQS
jgi:hypothetical protein